MKTIYTDLLKQYRVNTNSISKLWDNVSQQYNARGRHYHNLSHLNDLYTQLLPLKTKIENWNVILFTLFYHDVIYSAVKEDNEERSAELAEMVMQKIGVPSQESKACKEQILATKAHSNNINSDTNFFTDADLSILGRDRKIYEAYCKNIRKEYAIFPNFIYKKGRRKVIKRFLSMDRIFKTEDFFKKFEEQARINLQYELKVSYS